MFFDQPEFTMQVSDDLAHRLDVNPTPVSLKKDSSSDIKFVVGGIHTTVTLRVGSDNILRPVIFTGTGVNITSTACIFSFDTETDDVATSYRNFITNLADALRSMLMLDG